MSKRVVLGTRGSALARWQTAHVASLLQAAWSELVIETQLITTQGDKIVDTPLPLIGGKGVFTAELEAALLRGEIDFAVHSLKDLPTEYTPGLTIGAVPVRASAGDALISRNRYTLKTLPSGAKIGTSSRRRAAQILYMRPDLTMLDIRGNIDTRLKKALDGNGDYDAIVLAQAGLERLEQTHLIAELLTPEDMLPAPGQGALAIQCRDNADSLRWLKSLNNIATEAAVTAERAFLASLGGGCSVPVAAYATVDGDQMLLRGRITAPDGSAQLDISLTGEVSAAREIGRALAQMAVRRGGDKLLAMSSE